MNKERQINKILEMDAVNRIFQKKVVITNFRL